MLSFMVAVVFCVFASGTLAAGAEAVDHIVEPEELVHFNITQPPPGFYDNWTDWESWEAKPEIAMFLPYYRSGYDMDGLVVYIVDFGKWNHRQLVHMPKEQVEEFWKYYEQYARRLEKDAALCNNQGTVFIADWDGFSLGHYASSSALQSALKMFVQILRLNHDIKYGIHINVNYTAETFINMGRPFLGNMFDKFEIYGTRVEKWKEMILRKIRSSQLPPKYGGDKGWKPLSFN